MDGVSLPIDIPEVIFFAFGDGHIHFHQPFCIAGEGIPDDIGITESQVAVMFDDELFVCLVIGLYKFGFLEQVRFGLGLLHKLTQFILGDFVTTDAGDFVNLDSLLRVDFKDQIERIGTFAGFFFADGNDCIVIAALCIM